MVYALPFWDSPLGAAFGEGSDCEIEIVKVEPELLPTQLQMGT